jgi:N-sulfoglucosamine sulfohydrolase
VATAHDVVVMTTHDIGRHLRCYGVRSVKSPNLDALAAGGVRFANAFATAPQCSPSRASLATGMYPHNNGVLGLAHRGFDWELSVPHAAAIFADHGFAAHLFGGQHVTPHPERLGFHGMHQIDALQRVLASSGDARLYLEVNFDETHRPYPPAGRPPADLVVPGYLPQIPEAVEEMTALEQTIAAMDAAAGRVFEALEETGRSDQAIVVFTTDHGLAMPRAKCTLYDPGIEVALLVRWPAGGVSGGAVREEMVSNIDILPALFEAAGVAIPDRVQGRSLLTGGGRDAIFAEKTFHSYYDPMRGVRTRRHKYIRNFESAFAVEVPGDIQAGPIFRSNPTLYSADRPSVVELYDLEEDPLEQRNLAGRQEVADVERELGTELWRWMRETKDPLLSGPVPSPHYRLAIQR